MAYITDAKICRSASMFEIIHMWFWKGYGLWYWLISLKFVLKGPIDDKSALVQMMAWHQIGDKPLPEPMLTQFTDV